jgi:hypothetical protein
MPHQLQYMPRMARREDRTDAASSMIDGRTEEPDKTKRRRFPHLSLCAHKSCFRILRKDKCHRSVLCPEHRDDLKIAVAEMLYDWCSPNTPSGISASTSRQMSAPQITMRRRQVLDGPQNRARPPQRPQPYQNQQQTGRIREQATYDRSLYPASFTQGFSRVDAFNSD